MLYSQTCSLLWQDNSSHSNVCSCIPSCLCFQLLEVSSLCLKCFMRGLAAPSALLVTVLYSIPTVKCDQYSRHCIFLALYRSHCHERMQFFLGGISKFSAVCSIQTAIFGLLCHSSNGCEAEAHQLPVITYKVTSDAEICNCLATLFQVSAIRAILFSNLTKNNFIL